MKKWKEVIADVVAQAACLQCGAAKGEMCRATSRAWGGGKAVHTAQTPHRTRVKEAARAAKAAKEAV